VKTRIKHLLPRLVRPRDHQPIGLDLLAYLEARYGSGWSLLVDRQVAELGEALLMDDFRPGVGCCSITALAFVFAYHRRNSPQLTLPGDIQVLFAQLEKLATHHGYSPTKGRTNPLRISGLVRAAWRQFGCRGRSRSVLQAGRRLMIREIDHNRPALLNIAFGYYRRHTVTLVGYQVWQKGGPAKSPQHLPSQFSQLRPSKSSEITLLKVFDGWSRTVRYIDFSALCSPLSGDFSLYSLIVVRPETVGE
jgi:hypothetical protein